MVGVASNGGDVSVGDGWRMYVLWDEKTEEGFGWGSGRGV